MADIIDIQYLVDVLKQKIIAEDNLNAKMLIDELEEMFEELREELDGRS